MHAHFTKARFYAIPIAVLMGIKKIYFTIHSSLGVKTQIKLLTRLWYSWANSVSKVIVVSENIAVMYKSNWPNAQVRRIYLGVDHSPLDRNESRQLLGIPNQQLMLLTVANFNYIKGLDYLIKSIAYLKSKDMWLDKAHLYIVGQTEKDKQELNTLIKSLELEDDVTLVGISNCVAEFMASADLYIQPSRSEGLPLALMEASSFSLPLIGCNVGGIPEIIVDGYNGSISKQNIYVIG